MGVVEAVIANAALVLVAGLIALVGLGAASMAVSPKNAGNKRILKASAVGVGVSLITIGGVGLVMQGGGGEIVTDGCPPGQIRVNGVCTAIPAITWTYQIPATPAHAQHDVATEYPDSPAVPGDGGTPDLNLVSCAYATNAFVDRASLPMKVKWNINIATTAATTNAAYQATDMCNVDVLLQPGFIDLNGDGDMDQIPYYVRLRDFSPTTNMQFSVGNSTQSLTENAIYHSSTFGWHVGIGAEIDAPAWAHENADHAYQSMCSPGAPGYSPSSLSQQCYSRWIQAGIYDDGDPDGISLWLMGNNNGFFGYLSQTNVGSFTTTWDIGVPQSYFTIVFEVNVGTVS